MEEISLPTKTKIAAWWMIVFGAILSVRGLATIIFLFTSPSVAGAFPSLGGLIYFPFFFFGWFIKKGKRWAVSLADIHYLLTLLPILYSFFTKSKFPFLPLLIFIFGELNLFNLLLLLSFFIPLILLHLDRENFWKIAT